MGRKWDQLWKNFDKLMSDVDEVIEEEIKSDNIFTTEEGATYRVNHSSSTTTVNHGKKKIVVETVDGKTTIKVDGKEYIQKEK